MTEKLRAWFILGRVSNLPTVWTNVIAAWLLNGGEIDGALVCMGLGASLLYVGGTTLNDFFDVAFDREYRKERPIPAGILSRMAVGWVSVGYLLLGSVLIGLGGGGVWYWVVLLIAAIVFYDYHHKDWVGSVFVMGGCRFFLSLLAASGVNETLDLTVWFHAGGLWVYIVALSLTARSESRPSESGSTIRFLFLIPLAAPVAAALLGQAIWGLLLAALAGFSWVIANSLVALRRREDPARVGKAVSLMLAGVSWLDAAFLAIVGPGGVLVAAGYFLARWLQRSVPAT